jgi:hypothetical protein
MTVIRHNPSSLSDFRAAHAAAAIRDVRVLNLLIAAATLAFFVGYLVLNTQTAAKGFTVRTIEKRLSDLEETRQRLDLEVVANQSMDAIGSSTQGLGMVPVTSVDYVNTGSGAVALK